MSDDIRWVKTHCSRMDHGGCALRVGVKNNAIVKIKGDLEGFLNKGYVCSKGLAAAKRLDHPARLKHPLKRAGRRGEGKWREISWPEAIEEITNNLSRIKEEHGARSVIFGQGMPKGLELFVLNRLATLFGSPNMFGMADLCHLPRELSGIYTCGFYPVADLHRPTKLVVLWGSNITSTNEEGQVCRLLLERLRGGAELIIVDPRRTELASRARLCLQLRPGSDAALALAFLHVIIREGIHDREFVSKWTHGFDELAREIEKYPPERMAEVTWVPADTIREAARLYAGARPAAIQWGNAIEQNIHTFDSVRALLCLMAISGNLDVPGGNIQANEPKTLRLGKFVHSEQLPNKRSEMLHARQGTLPRLITVPPTLFRRAVIEGRPYPVKGAYMQCTNPLLAFADSPMTYEALMKLDFFAVSDIVMTPTANLADVVLPAATTFEFNDIGHYGLGHGLLFARPKVVDPPEDCWPDCKILNELGKALTPPEFWYDDWEKLLEEVLKPAGMSYREFVEKGVLKGPERFRKYEETGFRTPTGKVELALSKAGELGVSPLPRFSGLPEEEDPEYPLVLTSCKSRYYLHSSYRWLEPLRRKRPRPKVEIHPRTAETLGIRHGDPVIIETRWGAITQFAHLTDRIHPRVVNAAYGWWFGEEDTGGGFDWKSANYNMLTSAGMIGKELGTPNLKGIGCRLKKKS
ncbi:MAG: molybdopterin-dependent oxidoreductase [Deltaproteobacteria bacterium]|nr:molybdopterin-dependent oxidoreductase [Deltaproteobacteria bacterium]MBW2127867.1 molybdopterin-dependent oxidoreductase [Deltaproteobacteria bacterium]